MATPGEIIQQAVDECAQIDARYVALCAEIQRQRRAALETVPQAAGAFRAWEKAVEAAQQAYAKRLAGLGEKTRSVEAEAPAAQGAAEIAALDAWHADRRKADQKRDRAVEKAMQAYEAAFDLGTKTVGPSRDARISDARRKRDAALADATNDHSADLETAWNTYRAATAKAQQAAIDEIAEARGAETLKEGEAATVRDDAIRRADAMFEAALAAEPLASAVLEAFAEQLRRATADCNNEKAVVTARMRAALGS